MIKAYEYLDLMLFASTLVSLSTAFVLGSIIGYERQVRQRTAGLRTNILVAVGAALFVDMAARLHGIYGGNHGAVHVIAYVVSGIGFLGAVGAAAGAGLILEACLGALFVLSANTVMRPIVNHINRQPLDTLDTEVTSTLVVIAPKERQNEAYDLMEIVLEKANYPFQDVEINAFGEHEVEIEAKLVSQSIDGDDFDKVIDRLKRSPFTTQVFWSASTSE
ncbi:MgtC/SapB family protein [Thiomicrospira sp. ALE5]|uniref:MgtC/SapB family protein n=1 Tax=Thiomicrospira sp. ALE5 TaxID=748650 RepID=UPI0008F22655|nr:MgtC/SapB family protein [Thiomicrospira sp. ALE5]SFR61046.1 putative Mg2+ transporter-C (MgtC) family protein [Thiomicrospira sp. ALE5]